MTTSTTTQQSGPVRRVLRGTEALQLRAVPVPSRTARAAPRARRRSRAQPHGLVHDVRRRHTGLPLRPDPAVRVRDRLRGRRRRDRRRGPGAVRGRRPSVRRRLLRAASRTTSWWTYPVTSDEGGDVHRTPDGLDDRTAATLAIAGSTAAAVLAVVNPGPADTLLIGGAGGGVVVFAVQLARLAGARVIGTGSAASGDALRAFGRRAGRLRRRAGRQGPRAPTGDGVTAAVDLYGTETIAVARELGVPDSRMTTIAAVVDGTPPANGASAVPGAIEEIARRSPRSHLQVPIAATFRVDDIRAAVERQAGRHVHGKVVVDLKGSAT